MAFTLFQTGHGHSHGGLSSNGHGHSHESHENKKGHSHDTERHGSGKKMQGNASVRAAFVHVIGDLLQSISVLISALIIFFRVRHDPNTYFNNGV